MPALVDVLSCFMLAAICWTIIGTAVGSHVLPRGLVFAAAPTIGWAVYSVIAATVFRWLEMGRVSADMLLGIITCAALVSLHGKKPAFWPTRRTPVVVWITLLCGAIALAGTVIPAVFPHHRGDQIALASPIFDHSKVALVNEFVQSGLPAVNPMFGEAGQPAPLPYYYLWHFSAAAMALSTNSSGWEADIALTWFTALAALSLMMGIAAWLGQSAAAAGWALLLAATASVRPFLADLFGYIVAYDVTGWPSGFGAWLFQTTWAPQHVQSAGCAIVALLMLPRLARAGFTGALVLALVIAASFESSAWVGGVTLALTAAVLGAWTLLATPPAERLRLIAYALIAVLLAAVVASPFIVEQIQALSARDAGFPISISPAEILGDSVPERFRRPLDIPAFYMVYLPVELCAIYLVGIPVLTRFRREIKIGGDRADALRVLVCSIAIGFVICGTLRSTVASNNDLAWRGALPAVMLLTAAAGAGFGAYWPSMRPILRVLTVGLVVLGVIQGALFVQDNSIMKYRLVSHEFETPVDMWQAVRQHSDRTERVVNNPMFLGDMTAWPVNISWALLSQRRSCYAGEELATAFIAKPKPVLDEIDGLFARVFAGQPHADDLREMALKYDCRVVVVTPSDPAWERDPFATSAFYRLAEQRDHWRIYRTKGPDPGATPR